ncbi:hypothetical protein MON38_11880 [Hymenobacter sp. DH14]|uniref:Uncharacterized protein n=1 Tax=Hymenobacter cyanobacteriorum TaxID=2926463 RepID=A0A9X1VFB3_9BACT|nr:hypothetical protein [Hymenobacter cyanobacteriorum]MCI1188119.1 hypothetical protein [Hymenobacter cyanobacteriorum]
MNVHRLILWAVLLAAGGSCARRPPHMGSGPPQAMPAADVSFASFGDKAMIGREAAIERRYATDAACLKAARRYHKNVLHNAGEPVPYTSSPLTYSFPKPGNGGVKPKELRFTTAAVVDSSNVSFLEVEQASPAPTDSTNARELRDVVKELVKAGATIVRKQEIDPNPINGKRAWRVVLHTDKPINSSDKRLVLEGTFGLVINPPYP